MKELKEMLVTCAEDAIDMTESTMKLFPDIKITDCFPYEAYVNTTIDGKDYRIHFMVECKEMKWS